MLIEKCGSEITGRASIPEQVVTLKYGEWKKLFTPMRTFKQIEQEDLECAGSDGAACVSSVDEYATSLCGACR